MAGKAAEPQAVEPKFDKADIIAQSRQILGKSPDVVAGALHAVNKPITINQVREKVAVYLSRPINTEGGN